jgi:NADH:ubiquinone oxidoreductase subunit
MEFLKQFFTWWNGQTLGTRFYTWRHGRFVGADEFGNRYYETRDGRRRWVIYAGYAEPSTIPPLWHGWIHHRRDRPPVDETQQQRPWQKPHQPNLTGTAEAYRPPGSLLAQRPKAVELDYEPWQPNRN